MQLSTTLPLVKGKTIRDFFFASNDHLLTNLSLSILLEYFFFLKIKKPNTMRRSKQVGMNKTNNI